MEWNTKAYNNLEMAREALNKGNVKTAIDFAVKAQYAAEKHAEHLNVEGASGESVQFRKHIMSQIQPILEKSALHKFIVRKNEICNKVVELMKNTDDQMEAKRYAGAIPQIELCKTPKQLHGVLKQCGLTKSECDGTNPSESSKIEDMLDGSKKKGIKDSLEEPGNEKGERSKYPMRHFDYSKDIY